MTDPTTLATLRAIHRGLVTKTPVFLLANGLVAEGQSLDPRVMVRRTRRGVALTVVEPVGAAWRATGSTWYLGDRELPSVIGLLVADALVAIGRA